MRLCDTLGYGYGSTATATGCRVCGLRVCSISGLPPAGYQEGRLSTRDHATLVVVRLQIIKKATHGLTTHGRSKTWAGSPCASTIADTAAYQ
jgi:hypothetical protein